LLEIVYSTAKFSGFSEEELDRSGKRNERWGFDEKLLIVSAITKKGEIE